MSSTEIIRFFNVLFSTLRHDSRFAVADFIAEIEYNDKTVYTSEEVTEILRRAESSCDTVISTQGSRIATLAGALSHQLVAMAAAAGVTIAPKVSELEDEETIKLITAQPAAQVKSIDGSTHVGEVKELERQVATLKDENAALLAQLDAKLQGTAQFQNIVRMLATKNARIADLEKQLKPSD